MLPADAGQYVEANIRAIAPEPPTPAEELLGDIRIGWRELAGETALVIRASVASNGRAGTGDRPKIIANAARPEA